MKLLVDFGNGNIQDPAIASVILETGIAASIERAMMEEDGGWVLLSIEDGEEKRFSDALAKYGVSSHIQTNSVVYNPDECVDCGLCTSLCMKHVFSFDKDWKLVVDADRCVLCGRCAEFCPQRALTVQK
ncbi:MAG: 4Fe-4S binding protein [Methanocorpusculum sp.]|nr:4Fe-4S binding protein [Methanocorpusculum sp.]